MMADQAEGELGTRIQMVEAGSQLGRQDPVGLGTSACRACSPSSLSSSALWRFGSWLAAEESSQPVGSSWQDCCCRFPEAEGTQDQEWDADHFVSLCDSRGGGRPRARAAGKEGPRMAAGWLV